MRNKEQIIKDIEKFGYEYYYDNKYEQDVHRFRNGNKLISIKHVKTIVFSTDGDSKVSYDLFKLLYEFFECLKTENINSKKPIEELKKLCSKSLQKKYKCLDCPLEQTCDSLMAKHNVKLKDILNGEK